MRRCQKAAERHHSRMQRELLNRDIQLDSLLAFSGRPD